MPERVQVIYFPKRARAPQRTSLEVPSTDPSASRTIEFRPEFAEEDPVTETLETPEPAASSAPSDPPPARKRRKVTVEVDTDPALRYHVQKLQELLESESPAEPLRGMDRRELAGISIFGHQLFEAGRLEEARVVFEGLVGLDVEDAFPHTMLGTVYLALGSQDRALALFEAALSIDPDDLAARVYRAEIRINQGRHARAIEDLDRALREGSPEDPFVERAARLKKILGARQKRRR